tara:strand:+ start:182 stop:475 length:294 start_codon:yes stop_codon:yes gene_type:complete
MKKEKWSDYSGYLVLTDTSNGKLSGTYVGFLEYKRIKDILNNIAFSDKPTYSYEGNTYNRKVSSNEAKNILNNLNDLKWTENTDKIFLISNQLGVRI